MIIQLNVDDLVTIIKIRGEVIFITHLGNWFGVMMFFLHEKKEEKRNRDKDSGAEEATVVSSDFLMN